MNYTIVYYIFILFIVFVPQSYAINKCISVEGKISYQDRVCEENKKSLAIKNKKKQVETPSVLSLPRPPRGYSWVEAPEIKGAFLRPSGWYFKSVIKNDTQAYFITKENIDLSGSFFTGITINVLRRITSKTGVPPSVYAKNFIKVAASEKINVKEPWENRMTPFISYGVVLLNEDSVEGNYITHNLLISNDMTGTLYFIIFEAPEKSWDSAMKIGEEILKKLYIDTDI